MIGEGCPLHLRLGRFIWGCVNYANNLKPHSRLKEIQFFLRRSKPSVAWIYQIKKGKLLEKAEWISSYSWYLRAIEVNMCQREIGLDIGHLFVWYHDWRQKTITVCVKFVWYAVLVISLCRFFLDYIFFYTPTCSDENVLREFGNSKT